MTPPTDTTREDEFEALWERFEAEGGFSSEALDEQRAALQDEIARLEAALATKREALQALGQREETARQQLRALLAARLGPEAILNAMRTEYGMASRPKRAEGTASGGGAPAAGPLGDDDKADLLKHLDHEGLTLGELRKSTGRESPQLQALLKALLAEGKVTKFGERRGSRYKLAD